MKWLKNISQLLVHYGTPIMYTLFAVVFFIVSKYTQTSELRIALLIPASGYVILAITNIATINSDNSSDKRHQEIIDKLEQIRLELEKKEPSGGTGVAIADVISSGLKYYTEHIAKPKEEDKDD